MSEKHIMQINDDDYIPINTFVLRWRWDEKHAPTIPAEELSSIRPLKIAKAQEVYATLGDFDDSNIGLVKYSEFTRVAQFSIEGEPAIVRQWLESTIPHSDQPIILSWGPTIAVVTDLTTFTHWWDMFCYPASDDVFIWPITEEWMLRYRHEEVFYFATGSQENSGSSGFAGVIGKSCVSRHCEAHLRGPKQSRFVMWKIASLRAQ